MEEFCGNCNPKLREACDEMYLLTAENIKGPHITCPGPVKVDGKQECGIPTTAEAAYEKAKGKKQEAIGEAIGRLYDPKFVAEVKAGMAGAGREVSWEAGMSWEDFFKKLMKK